MEARIDLVDAALDASRPAALGLVAHRVGEGLDRRRRRDPVPVEVEQRMQVDEALRTVAVEDRHARGAKAPPDEESVFGREGP
jgi:hypothetical protein